MKLVEPGSGADDMGAGMALGFFAWGVIITLSVIVIILTVKSLV